VDTEEEVTPTLIEALTETPLPSPTPTLPAPEGADLPDSAVRSVNDQGQEVIFDKPGGDALWTLVEDENGEPAWQKTETIQEKISVSLPAAEYWEVAVETRKAIEEEDLTHEEALELWRPVLDLHFPPEVVAGVWSEVSYFEVDENGLVVLKTEQGQSVLQQEADGTSFMLSREFVEQNLELMTRAFPYYFSFLPHVPFALAEDIYEASLEGEEVMQSELGRNLTTIQSAYRQLVNYLTAPEQGYEILGFSSTGSLVLEKEGKRFYFEEAMEASNASGITDQERREADLEQGIMYDVVTIVSEKTAETDEYVPGKSGVKIVFRGPEAFKFSSDGSEPKPAELVKVDDENTGILYKNMVAAILETYPQFAGYEIVYNLSPVLANEMVKMEAEEARREWSPNSWKHFHWKTAQLQTGEKRIEVKAVAAQSEQNEEDLYVSQRIELPFFSGLDSFNQQPNVPIQGSIGGVPAAKRVYESMQEANYEETDGWLWLFTVKHK
jgi:hypothetical protein